MLFRIHTMLFNTQSHYPLGYIQSRSRPCHIAAAGFQCLREHLVFEIVQYLEQGLLLYGAAGFRCLEGPGKVVTMYDAVRTERGARGFSTVFQCLCLDREICLQFFRSFSKSFYLSCFRIETSIGYPYLFIGILLNRRFTRNSQVGNGCAFNRFQEVGKLCSYMIA